MSESPSAATAAAAAAAARTRACTVVPGHLRTGVPMAVERTRRRRPGQVVAIVGGIGAGKTTVCEAVRDMGTRTRYVVLDEPLDLFVRTRGATAGAPVVGDMLSLYYAEPKRWALSFQGLAFSSRVTSWSAAGYDFSGTCAGGDTLLVERSLWDDWLFAQLQYSDGNMKPIEYAVYDHLRAAAWDLAPALWPSHIVYLDTPPDECIRRAEGRARAEELCAYTDTDTDTEAAVALAAPVDADGAPRDCRRRRQPRKHVSSNMRAYMHRVCVAYERFAADAEAGELYTPTGERLRVLRIGGMSAQQIVSAVDAFVASGGDGGGGSGSAATAAADAE